VDEAFEKIGPSVSMKICTPDIIHKFDAGGVFLKIKTKEQASESFEKRAKILKGKGTFRIRVFLSFCF